MTWAIIGLMAGFILILVMLYLLLLKTELAPGLKLLALVVCTLFYWIQYASLKQYTGWQTTEDLPAEFVLIASEVHEPDKKIGEPGVMYWWIRESGDPRQPPRLYELPYQVDLHQKTEEVVQEQERGGRYVARKTETSQGADGLVISFEKVSKVKPDKKPVGTASSKK